MHFNFFSNIKAIFRHVFTLKRKKVPEKRFLEPFSEPFSLILVQIGGGR